MGTRCSARAPGTTAGRAAAGGDEAGLAGDTAGVAAGALLLVEPPLGCLPRNSTTSDLVRRPSRPEAGMEPGSSLFSSTRRRTDGLSLPSASPLLALLGEADAFAELAAAAAAAGLAAAPPAAAVPAAPEAPASSMTARICPL